MRVLIWGLWDQGQLVAVHQHFQSKYGPGVALSLINNIVLFSKFETLLFSLLGLSLSVMCN